MNKTTEILQDKVRVWTLAVCFIGIVIAGGCRATQSMGDRMSDLGVTSKKLGDNWNRGEAMVKKGEKLQQQSESYAEKSESKQAESARLIEEGRELMSGSETAYGEQFKSKR